MREIVFDTETTGLSPLDGHRLVEFGALELINRVETGAHFHAYFNPLRAMPSDAYAVHGLSDAFLADKPGFADRVEELLVFIGDSPLIAHNAVFDFSFLNWELEACGRTALAMERMVCTLMLARTRHPGAKHSLDALCTRYGVDRSQRVLHGALLDAQLLCQVYVELTGGRQIGLVLTEQPPRREGNVFAFRPAERPYRPARPHAPSFDELARHAAFVAGLVDPLWRDAAPDH
ncbi:MAG: DNA polymerase III subunit epsilon [Sphingomonadaceae bacterium]|nr:DNA polymerase III subunit epsilon [Sphingomonadaceae bacterium]